MFTVELNMPEAETIELIVYDMHGEKLIGMEEKIYGKHKMNLNLSRYSAGVYFVQMSTDIETFNVKLVITK